MAKIILIIAIAAYVIFVCVKKIHNLKKGKYCSCCDGNCCACKKNIPPKNNKQE